MIVLEHSDDNLRLQYLKNHESTTAFEKMLQKYYVNLIEKFFLILVLVDAVVTATKHTDMSNTWLLVLRCWQVSILKFIHSNTACTMSQSLATISAQTLIDAILQFAYKWKRAHTILLF